MRAAVDKMRFVSDRIQTKAHADTQMRSVRIVCKKYQYLWCGAGYHSKNNLKEHENGHNGNSYENTWKRTCCRVNESILAKYICIFY